MAFDDDATAQMRRIRSNLELCAHTPANERSELLDTINSALGGASDEALTMDHIYGIGSAVRQLAENRGLYFLGDTHPASRQNQYFSTRAEIKFISTIARALDADDLGLSVADQLERAKSLAFDLSDSTTFLSARQDNAALPLHRHGSPMWIAAAENPPLSDPTWLECVPARLGLGPDAVLPVRYVLMQVRVSGATVPRFADSGAYPYWAPGGLTKPIEQCPVELTGFQEIVANGICVGSLDGAVSSYVRTI